MRAASARSARVVSALPTALTVAEVLGDLADRVRAGAGGQPLGNLAAKLAVAEAALQGRAEIAGAVIGNTSGKCEGGKLRAGVRFAMTQVINYRVISPGISRHNTTPSRLFRGSQRLSASK